MGLYLLYVLNLSLTISNKHQSFERHAHCRWWVSSYKIWTSGNWEIIADECHQWNSHDLWSSKIWFSEEFALGSARLMWFWGGTNWPIPQGPDSVWTLSCSGGFVQHEMKLCCKHLNRNFLDKFACHRRFSLNSSFNHFSQIWNLIEKKHLFHALNEAQKSFASHHVVEMIEYFEIPLLEYLRRSEITKNVFDEQGQSAFEHRSTCPKSDKFLSHWKGANDVDVPDISLEGAEIVLNNEKKKQFLDFVRSMLKWLSEKRRRTVELLTDPWLKKTFLWIQIQAAV